MEGNEMMGLSHREILRQWEWALKYPPKEQDRLIQRLGEVLADILTRNNQLLAQQLAAHHEQLSSGDKP